MEEEDEERGQHIQRYDADNENEFNDEEPEFEEKNQTGEEEKFEIIEKEEKHNKPEIPRGPRITPKFLSKYEKSRIIGTRALQISKNAPVMIQFGKDDYDPIQIAEKELLENKIPYIIRRILPDGTYEDWDANELIRYDID